VLRRQLFAFCLDEWVGSGIADSALPDKTKEALDARDSHSLGQFPYTFLDYVQAHEERLLTGFKALLGTDLDPRVAQRLDGFMRGTDQDDALKIRLTKLLDELANERKSHSKRAEQIKQKIRDLNTRPTDEALVHEIERMERERQKALELGKENNQRELLNTLTDAGLIPNYAFPEAGVELKSLLWRKKASDDPAETGAYVSLPAERYERPANSALSEFAPENVFYANQRRVEVDQVNLQLSSVETWQLCPTCQHMRRCINLGRRRNYRHS
jgi:DEAD/DEAH box helicase domain-containing protein